MKLSTKISNLRRELVALYNLPDEQQEKLIDIRDEVDQYEQRMWRDINPNRKLSQSFHEVLQKWIDIKTDSIPIDPCGSDYSDLTNDLVLAVNKAEYNPIVSIDSIREIMTEVLTKHNVVKINVEEITESTP